MGVHLFMAAEDYMAAQYGTSMKGTSLQCRNKSLILSAHHLLFLGNYAQHFIDNIYSFRSLKILNSVTLTIQV